MRNVINKTTLSGCFKVLLLDCEEKWKSVYLNFSGWSNSHGKIALSCKLTLYLLLKSPTEPLQNTILKQATRKTSLNSKILKYFKLHFITMFQQNWKWMTNRNQKKKKHLEKFCKKIIFWSLRKWKLNCRLSGKQRSSRCMK